MGAGHSFIRYPIDLWININLSTSMCPPTHIVLHTPNAHISSSVWCMDGHWSSMTACTCLCIHSPSKTKCHLSLPALRGNKWAGTETKKQSSHRICSNLNLAHSISHEFKFMQQNIYITSVPSKQLSLTFVFIESSSPIYACAEELINTSINR